MEYINKYPKKDSKVVSKIIGEQTMAILVDEKPVGKDQVYIFNSTGTKFWELIDGKRNVEEIIKLMCGAFEVDYEKAKKETIEFITDLSKKRLISI